ncbi:apolipoprotein N-acyltransferase [Aquifex pyrophilus]
MHNSGYKEVFIGIVAGILFYLSFSKYNLFFLIFPALFLGVRKNPIRFFSFGLTSFFLSLIWIRISLIDYGGINPLIGYTAVILLVLFLTLYQFGTTYILWKIFRFNYFSFPFIYTFVELIRSFFPYGGFPWLILGINLVDIPVLRFSLTAGTVYFGSLVALFISLFPLLSGRMKTIILGLLTPLLIFGIAKEREPLKFREKFKVALVQTAIPEDVKLNKALFWERYPRILKLVEEAIQKNPNLVILPESAVPFYLSELEFNDELLKFSRKVPIITGIIEVNYGDKFEAYNSVVFLKDGKVVDIYRKIILVPFGEYTPYPFKFFSEFVPYLGLQDYSRGKKVKCFNLNGLNIGTPICFEIAYAFFIKSFGCDILAVLTNNAWFRDSDGNYQHMKWARARALENEKFILWVNNIGPSAVINPKGEVVKELPYGKEGILLYTF